jgi:hypothetical protein
VRRRFGSCRASNPLDRYKDTTPFPVQRLINNDWQSRWCENSAVLCLPTKLSELPQAHKRWHRSASSFAVRPAAEVQSIVGLAAFP